MQIFLSFLNKTWFKVSEAKTLDTRRQELSEYLQKLCIKKELSNDSDLHHFINLEENLHNKLHFYKEKLLYKFPDVDLGVREFVCDEEQKIVMAVCRDENVQTRILSYWDNLKLSFLSKGDDTHSTVGALVVFRILSQDPWHVEKIFVKSFKTQTNCIAFCKETNVLAVGLASGKIRIFEIPVGFKFVQGVVYESSAVKPHSAQVNGVAIDSSLGYVYSIGKDGKFCVSDRTSCEVVWSKGFDKFELTALYNDAERHRLFMADSGGVIHVFSVKKYPPKRLTSIRTSVTNAIRSIACSESHDRLFAGTVDGSILCFNLGGYGKEKKDTKEYPYALKGKGKCQSLCRDEANNGVLSGNQSGNVAVWYPEENRCVYVFNAHLHKVTSMYWNKDERRLITGSSDGKIKVWQLPRNWVEVEGISKTKAIGKSVQTGE